MTYAFPIFFKNKIFRDLRLSYLIGIGCDIKQVRNLMLDFVNLYLVSMYVLNFRNPLLVKSVQKVFWQFPAMSDSPEQLARLDPKVRAQLKWRAAPQAIDSAKYVKIKEKLAVLDKGEGGKRVEHARQEYHFEQQLFRRKIDLNDVLVTYIDMKYSRIWSEDFCKEVKWYFKDQSLYFRVVKQGSVLCYLTFHIFTVISIMLLAIIRRSLISIGYYYILLPNLKDAADVLK